MPKTGPLTPKTGPITPPVSPMQNGASYGHGREPPLAVPKIFAVPSRARQAEEVLPYFNNLGLTRTHRQLFLLIDGKRNVQDLMRLMRQQSDEISALLADLERANLIRL